jgi:CHAT domain-containing protein
MATGARTVLLSRWRTGGRTSYDLVREFAQELPHTTAADAWQRSVQLSMHSEVDPAKEPRIDEFTADKRVKAEHPFFWSGYLLVDTGATPRREPAAEEKPPAKEKPPAAKKPAADGP